MKRKNKNYLIIRKNIFKHLLAMLILFVGISATAQDQKTLFKKWGNTKLSRFKVMGEKGKAEISSNPMPKYGAQSLSFINEDDKYMWAVRLTEHFSSKDRHTDFYVTPEQQAHPTFLMRGTVVLDKLKYHRSFEAFGSKKNRLVIVGDYMYELKHISKSDSWKIQYLYLNKKVKITQIFKLLKKLNAMDHYKLVDDYLAKEDKILKGKMPEFKKNNSAYYSALNQEDAKVNKRIVESKKTRYEQLVGSVARVENKTGHTIWVGHKTGGGTQKLKPGETARFTCNLADVYLLGPNGDKANASFLFKPKSMCGKKYTVR